MASKDDGSCVQVFPVGAIEMPRWSEFNFLVLHYLKGSRYKEIAEALESRLFSDGLLPKRTLFNGSAVRQTYDEIVDRVGSGDPNELLSRFIWCAHNNRLYPNIEGDLIVPKPEIMLGDVPINAITEDTMQSEPAKSLIRRSHFRQSISPYQRLISTTRGACSNSAIQKTTLIDAIYSTRLGFPNLPLHLRSPISNHSKFHFLTRRRGHALECYFVLYDKTGNRIITGSDDWLIKIWSAQTGILVQTLRGHKQAITYLAVDPTGKLLASSSEDNTIRIWSLTSFAPLAVLQQSHSKPVVYMAWSPDPAHPVLISAAQDGNFKIWDPIRHRQVKDDISTLIGTETSLKFECFPSEVNSPIQCGTMSPGGTRAATGCKDGSVRVWSLDQFKMIQRISAHSTNVGVVVWSHIGARFLSAADDGSAKIWDYKNAETGWQCVHSMSVVEVPGTRPRMIAAQWSLDDRYVVLSFQRMPNGTNIKLFDANTGTLVSTLNAHTNDVHAIDVHPIDPRIIATAGYDQKIILWNLETQKPVSILEVPNYEEEESALTEVHFSPDGTQVVACDITGTFSLYGLGPNSAYKGPIEQFFVNDYSETVVDQEGFVIDTETQTPPHLIPRGPLCFRGGRQHDSPPIPPAINDPAASLTPSEIESSTIMRAEQAELETSKYEVAQERLPVTRSKSTAGASPARPPPRSTRTRQIQPANTQSSRNSSRPLRNAARRITSFSGLDSEDDVILDPELEQLAAEEYRAIRDLEDAFEEDFVESSDSDESISSDGAGGRVRDRIDDDLYWSGNESFEGRVTRPSTAAERAARREARGNRRASERISRFSQRNLRSRRHDYNDDDEETFGSHVTRSSSHRPPTRSSRSSRRILEDDEDEELDIEESSDMSLESDNDHHQKEQAPKQKSQPKSVKPSSYPSWVLKPLSTSISYCPQVGDEIVFSRTGHAKYAAVYNDFVDNVPDEIPDLVFCTISSVRYECKPFIHSIIELTTIMPQPPIPNVDTDPQHDGQNMPAAQIVDSDANEGRRLRVRISSARPSSTSSSKPFVSVAQTALMQSSSSSTATNSSIGHGPLQEQQLKFTVHYHGATSELPEYIVLASRFNQALATPWYTGKPFGMWMPDNQDETAGDYYTGYVLEVRSDDGPWEAITVAWDDETSDTLQVSPWEIDAIDKSRNPLQIHVEALSSEVSSEIISGMEEYIKTNPDQVALFLHPVPLSDYPAYIDVVAYPIDLGTIIARLKQNYYRNIESLKFDIQALAQNAALFNGAESELTELAKEVSESVLVIVDSIPNNSQLVCLPHFPQTKPKEAVSQIPAQPKSNQKKRKKPTKKKRAFGVESSDSEDIDPDDLLPVKKPKTADSSTHVSTHEEDASQLHTDQSSETLLTRTGRPMRRATAMAISSLRELEDEPISDSSGRRSRRGGSTHHTSQASENRPTRSTRSMRTRSSAPDGDEMDDTLFNEDWQSPRVRTRSRSTSATSSSRVNPQRDGRRRVDESSEDPSEHDYGMEYEEEEEEEMIPAQRTRSRRRS